MRLLRPSSSRPLVLSSLAVCAIAGGIWFQIARRADAQLEGTLGGPVVSPLALQPTPIIEPPVDTTQIDINAPVVEVAARPILLPPPPPIPDKERVRVGLSTERGALAIWSQNGLILRDLRQPARALRSAPGEIVKFDLGAPANARSGATNFRGTISLDINGRKSSAWQWVSIEVPGNAAARVTSDGKNARYGRPYRGGFEVFPQMASEPDHRKNELSIVNVLGMEDYLKGVVPWEMEPSAPLEALKAQAICARGETMNFKNTKRFAAGRFDICDYDACQGYPGTENEKPATSLAVEQTRGLVAMNNGRIADTVYGTNSGGLSANSTDVWKTQPTSYLQSVRDFPADSPLSKIVKPTMTETDWRLYVSQSWPSYARPSDAERAKLAQRRATNARAAALYGPDDEPEFYRWKRFVSTGDALSSFAAKGFAQVTNFEVVQRTSSGHIRQLRVVGYAKPTPGASLSPGKEAQPLSVTLVGDGAIRAMFSGRLGSTTALPSSTFVVDPSVDASGKLLGWQISGAGWGHGVGMCQRGAANHALQGWDARKIIGWYYQGVEIRRLY